MNLFLPILLLLHSSAFASSLVVVTHPSTQWDFSAASRAGIERVYKYAQSKKIPVVTLYHDGEVTLSEDKKQKVNPESYYSFNGFMGEKVASVGGQIINSDGSFKINLYGVNKIILAGGDFRFCLCQAINDLIKIIAKSGKDIEFVLVPDAIYFQTQTIEYPQHFPHLRELAPTVNLQDLMGPFPDAQFGSFIRGYFFMLKTFLVPATGGMETKEIACYHHNDGLIALSDLNLSILRNGIEVKKMGSASGHKVKFDFINSDQLK